jgi:hypothetical protein
VTLFHGTVTIMGSSDACAALRTLPADLAPPCACPPSPVTCRSPSHATHPSPPSLAGSPLTQAVMLSGGDDGEVRVWEMATWSCLHVLVGRGSGINSIVSLGASPASAEHAACVRVACASDDGYIYSYEFQKEAGWCGRGLRCGRCRRCRWLLIGCCSYLPAHLAVAIGCASLVAARRARSLALTPCRSYLALCVCACTLGRSARRLPRTRTWCGRWAPSRASSSQPPRIRCAHRARCGRCALRALLPARFCPWFETERAYRACAACVSRGRPVSRRSSKSGRPRARPPGSALSS